MAPLRTADSGLAKSNGWQNCHVGPPTLSAFISDQLFSEATPVFTSSYGAELTQRVLSGLGDPVIRLPGGPLRAMRYLRNLRGPDLRRQLVMLELPRRRVDEVVGDVEALRRHLGATSLSLGRATQ